MTSDEAVLAAIDALERVAVPYMVVGSLSSNLYGIPRSTKDADFVLQTGPDTIQHVMRQLGPDFRLEPQVSFETVTGTTRHIIETIEGTFRIELFQLSDDAHDQERFSRRKRTKILACDAFAPTPEDVVITKLRWSRQGGRSRDIDDVRSVVAVQGDALDWDYIHRWCDEHGTRELLDDIRRSIPEI